MKAGLRRATCTLAFCMAFDAVAQAGDMTPALSQQESCMLNVLKAVPGVTITASHAPPPAMANDADYPFVEYKYQGHDIAFTVEKAADDSFGFVVELPTGLVGPGATKGGDLDWGTTDVEKAWKAQCGADAMSVLD